jgi:capreomycidine synthase
MSAGVLTGDHPASRPPGAGPPYLESWYREHLERARFDLSGSGVSPYTFGELRALTGIGIADLDRVSVDDSVSFGAPGLRRAIADRYTGGDAERVMATHGSSEAIALALSAIIDRGSVVAVLEPIYHSLRFFPDMRANQVIPLPLEVFETGVPDVARLEKLLRPGVSAIVVNFPHNPTGLHLSEEGQRMLQDIAESVGARLVWDSAFGELIHAGASTLPWAGRPGMVAFGTFSKAFGLPGLRVGWCIAPPEVLEKTLPMRDSTTLFLSPLVEMIAAAAMRSADLLIEPRLSRARANLSHLAAWVSQREDLIAWRAPGGGVCCFPRLPGVGDTERFCLDLLDATGVLLVPGEAFGSPGHVRLGFGGPSDIFAEGLEHFGSALRRWHDVR